MHLYIHLYVQIGKIDRIDRIDRIDTHLSRGPLDDIIDGHHENGSSWHTIVNDIQEYMITSFHLCLLFIMCYIVLCNIIDIDRPIDIYIERDSQIDRQADTQIHRYIDRQIKKQRNRQIGGQKDVDMDIETYMSCLWSYRSI